MVDHLTPAQRHVCMSRVRSKDTTPELAVRKILLSLGYRYKRHVKSLPGKPDFVIPSLRTTIFVNGCFWHGHFCKYLPKSNTNFWSTKLLYNKQRDKTNIRALKRDGWQTLVLWECQVKNRDKTTKKILSFFNEKTASGCPRSGAKTKRGGTGKDNGKIVMGCRKDQKSHRRKPINRVARRQRQGVPKQTNNT